MWWLVVLPCVQLGCGPSTDVDPVGGYAAGTIGDRIGDAFQDPRVDVPPDLKGVTVTANDDVLTATVSFAPGTLSRTDTHISVLLDTDEDSWTGFHIEDRPSGDSSDSIRDFWLGWDYVIDGPIPSGSTTARVSRPDEPGTTITVGTAMMSFLSEDDVRFTVPMDRLDGDDGHMTFRVAASQVQPVLPFIGTDYAPDLDDDPGSAAVLEAPAQKADAGY